jgi:outer membrane lipoprotein SlyB
MDKAEELALVLMTVREYAEQQVKQAAIPPSFIGALAGAGLGALTTGTLSRALYDKPDKRRTTNAAILGALAGGVAGGGIGQMYNLSGGADLPVTLPDGKTVGSNEVMRAHQQDVALREPGVMNWLKDRLVAATPFNTTSAPGLFGSASDVGSAAATASTVPLGALAARGVTTRFGGAGSTSFISPLTNAYARLALRDLENNPANFVAAAAASKPTSAGNRLLNDLLSRGAADLRTNPATAVSDPATLKAISALKATAGKRLLLSTGLNFGALQLARGVAALADRAQVARAAEQLKGPQ